MMSTQMQNKSDNRRNRSACSLGLGLSLLLLLLAGLLGPIAPSDTASAARAKLAQIEPEAGTWQTWALASGDEVRPEPPFAYDSVEMAAEMEELKNQQLTPKMVINAYFSEYAAGGTHGFWFWNEEIGKKVLEYRLDDNLPRAAQVYALTSIAYYDSFVACWDAKYAYWTMRPFQIDPTFQPLFKTPNHPSYPSAHACISAATAETLAHLFPRDAEAIRATAGQFLESRLWAGIHFRSDIEAGEALGQAVAQKVIERGQNDGSE